jgi:Flp pilus assembly protein TadD
LVLVEASELTEAVAEFKREIENNPADIAARLQIAATMFKVDSAAGLPYAQEAVKLAPRQPFGHFLLGLLLLDTGDYRGAIPELETARAAFPQEARLYFALGSAYSQAGRTADAARARATFQRLTEAGKSRGSGTAGNASDAGPEKIPVGDLSQTPR